MHQEDKAAHKVLETQPLLRATKPVEQRLQESTSYTYIPYIYVCIIIAATNVPVVLLHVWEVQHMIRLANWAFESIKV